MPRIEKVERHFKYPSGLEGRETRFGMTIDDIHKWKMAEKLVVEAARRLQLFFGIQGNAPPAPSTFHYDRTHKSLVIAKRMISVSRDWFVVWMGFLSYLTSSVELTRAHPPLPAYPMPRWYTLLRKDGEHPDFWLDGLNSSTVCSFNLKTPRAGIVFRWVVEDERRPKIKWFYDHHVPLWFTWTSAEEQAIRSDHRLSYLEPPVEMVQQALTLLFSFPDLPLAGLIIKKYYRLGNDPVTNETLDLLRLRHAPSAVFETAEKIFISETSDIQHTDTSASKDLKSLVESRQRRNQAAAELAASLPTEGMLETHQVGRKGKLFNHFDDFFSAREKRQAEMIRMESAVDRQSRESRDRDRPIKNSTMYTWVKVQSSGGRELYMRVRADKKDNHNVYDQYGTKERLYNAASNEWDFCKDFCFPGSGNISPSDSDFDDDMDDEPRQSTSEYRKRGNNSPSDSDFDDDMYDEPRQFTSEYRRSSPPPPPSPTGHAMDIVEESPPYSRDVFETLRLNYGFSSPLVDIVGSADHEWEKLLSALGFVKNLHELSVSVSEKHIIRVFISQIAKNAKKAVTIQEISPHLFDLNLENYNPLEHLFKFADVQRPSENLFVFHSPRSMACDWIIGVHSAPVVLYICRYILENPQAHTFVTIAHRLLERHIPFRTLLALPCSLRQKTIEDPYKPSSHRETTHQFTVADFETAMLRCQAVLSLPQGRAALLQGGIVGRIAKEYLSVDGILAGPSLEVTAHRAGYLGASGRDGILYCDDELTQNEIADICGTYTLYTGKACFF